MDKALAPTISVLLNIIYTIGYFVCSPVFVEISSSRECMSNLLGYLQLSKQQRKWIYLR